MSTNVFDAAACDEARRNKTLPEPTEHSQRPPSPAGRSVLDPLYESDPLGARGLKHPTPPQPTEKELVTTAYSRAMNRLTELQREMFLLQADIDTLRARFAALKSK